MGFFTFEITVFNEDSKSSSHNLPHKASRPESTIYFPERSKKESVIKCYHFENNSEPIDVFAIALREFCFLKLCDLLGIGPQIKCYSGFDIIFYADCVEFMMEKCVEIK